MLAAKELLPAYTEVIALSPTARSVVVKVATPEEFRSAVPSVAPPSSKVTRPAGVPPEALTVAVNVTLWPKTLCPDPLVCVVDASFAAVRTTPRS